MMEVEPLAEQDLPELAALYRQFRGEDSSLAKMRRSFRRLESDPRYTFLGVRQEGRLVGSLMGVLCEELYGNCRPFMVVEDLIVDQAHHRRGIGSLLMREIEQRARQAHCSYLMLVTDSSRPQAIAFYQSLGFSPSEFRGFKKYLDGHGS